MEDFESESFTFFSFPRRERRSLSSRIPKVMGFDSDGIRPTNTPLNKRMSLGYCVFLPVTIKEVDLKDDMIIDGR